jgi:hypothetical protein
MKNNRTNFVICKQKFSLVRGKNAEIFAENHEYILNSVEAENKSQEKIPGIRGIIPWPGLSCIGD